MEKRNGGEWIIHTPAEIQGVKIIQVHKMGGFWNWKKFRVEPTQFILFSENGIFEWKKAEE